MVNLCFCPSFNLLAVLSIGMLLIWNSLVIAKAANLVFFAEINQYTVVLTLGFVFKANRCKIIFQ